MPDHLKRRWENFASNLYQISNVSIPRWFGITSNTLGFELHGFSDASQEAIAAVIYLRVLNDVGEARVTIAAAKTKVAPLKHTTIPRLELSAAVLSVKLAIAIKNSLDVTNLPIHMWTDSTVALAWIKGHPSRWKDFVRNRVTFIQELPDSRWHHVSGKENPADLALRGVPPQRLLQETL